jgi:AraC-like DNA-binding protein
VAAVSEVFETTDIEVAEQLLRDSYGGNLRIDPRGRLGGIRLDRDQLTPSLRLDRLRLAISFEARANPFGALAIGHNRSGRVAYQSDGSERRYGPGDVSLSVQPEHPSTARFKDLDIDIAVIDPGLLSQVADSAPGRRWQPVRLTGYDPVSQHAARLWTSTFTYVRETALGSARAAAQPLLAASAARLLVAVALHAFPSNAVTDPTIEERHDAHPDTLRRAVAFIDENAHTNISVADIAAAAHVTIRAVQVAFRRHLDSTPMDYLRRVRLEHAHRDLIAADPDRQTVTAIAYRWGFPSASRFSLYYRRAYGVTPSRTLRG